MCAWGRVTREGMNHDGRGQAKATCSSGWRWIFAAATGRAGEDSEGEAGEAPFAAQAGAGAGRCGAHTEAGVRYPREATRETCAESSVQARGGAGCDARRKKMQEGAGQPGAAAAVACAAAPKSPLRNGH